MVLMKSIVAFFYVKQERQRVIVVILKHRSNRITVDKN